MQDFSKLRNAEIAVRTDEVTRKREQAEFFIAGPFIDPDTAEGVAPNSDTHGSSLRHYLNSSLSQQGILTYLGEDRILRTIGEKHYGDWNNAVVFERHYITSHLDGVIILPSSPGSFCELGDWASDEPTSKNTLILVDEQYRNRTSYFNDGVLKSALMNGAKVEFVPYSNRQRALEVCQNFIQAILNKKRVADLYGRHRRPSR